jgi:hypothetical protein
MEIKTPDMHYVEHNSENIEFGTRDIVGDLCYVDIQRF